MVLRSGSYQKVGNLIFKYTVIMENLQNSVNSNSSYQQGRTGNRTGFYIRLKPNEQPNKCLKNY